jgi:hypothetical protein
MKTTRRKNSEDSHLHTRRCENLKSQSVKICDLWVENEPVTTWTWNDHRNVQYGVLKYHIKSFSRNKTNVQKTEAIRKVFFSVLPYTTLAVKLRLGASKMDGDLGRPHSKVRAADQKYWQAMCIVYSRGIAKLPSLVLILLPCLPAITPKEENT